MTTDSRRRDAADDLRASTVADAEAGLAALFAADTRRRRANRLAVAAATTVALAAAWWGGSTVGGRTTEEAPPDPGLVTSTKHEPDVGICQKPRVTCLGDRTYRLELAVPLVWRIPRGYGVASGMGVASHAVESYRADSASGVTVLEGVRAASLASTAAPGVPATAAGWVQWVGSRPFLRASTPRRTTIDGRAAWQVRVSLRPHLPAGPGRCSDRFACYPVTFSAGAITGIWDGMVAEYTALDLPGAGTTVVWSWSFDRARNPLARNGSVVEGLSWPVP